VTKTRERPIVFSGPMVQAILDGRKSMTRRAIKPQPETYQGESGLQFEYPGWNGSLSAAGFARYCRHGVPGDRLWVRETWAPRLDVDPIKDPEKARHYALYRANGTSLDEPHWHSYPSAWRPSTSMPRWASRITLEITDVRVERLKDISVSDAWAEGFHDPTGKGGWAPATARTWFFETWNQINGDGSWESNPWAWVISFKKIHEIERKD
jgi:hypothetical protein